MESFKMRKKILYSILTLAILIFLCDYFYQRLFQSERLIKVENNRKIFNNGKSEEFCHFQYYKKNGKKIKNGYYFYQLLERKSKDNHIIETGSYSDNQKIGVWYYKNTNYYSISKYHSSGLLKGFLKSIIYYNMNNEQISYLKVYLGFIRHGNIWSITYSLREPSSFIITYRFGLRIDQKMCDMNGNIIE